MTKKHLSYISLSIFLLILGVYNLFNLLNNQEFGILNLDVRGNTEQLIATKSGELLKGDKVWGAFHSDYSNLGILSMRFYNGDRDSKDTLIFRFKEEGNDKWLYEAKYETDQFVPHQLFPFGFPIIYNSADRNYVFELESARGATGSGIYIDNSQPVFVAKSTYARSDLMNNNNLLIYFIKNKILNIFGDQYILANIFVCFLPLIIFLAFIATSGLIYQYLSIFAFTLILLDIFLLNNHNDYYYVYFLFLWSLISQRYRFETKISTLISFILYIVTSIIFVLGSRDVSEKTGVWALVFLLFSTIQTIFELNNSKIRSMTLRYFVKNLFRFEPISDQKVIKIPEKFLKVLYAIFLVYVFYSTSFHIYQAIEKYKQFYPTSYLGKFSFSFLLPEFILVLTLSLLYLYKRVVIVKSKILLVVIFTVFYFSTRQIIYQSLSFESLPTIFSVSPEHTNEAWVDVVVKGKNFRNIPFIGKVYISDIEQGEYLVLWSDEKIVFRTSPTLTTTGEIKVVPLDRKPSNSVPFMYNFKYIK